MTELPPVVLGVGDYIYARHLRLVQGEIVARGRVGPLDGFIVRRPDGVQDFIPEGDAVLLGGLSVNQLAWLVARQGTYGLFDTVSNSCIILTIKRSKHEGAGT